MMQRAEPARADEQGLLTRLRRDTAGNTLAIMAAALVPLIAFTGSAIDMARLYVVKVRLQQACDAGVLAGRHAMTDTSGTDNVLDSTATKQAQQFFANNFQAGWFQAANPVFSPQKIKQGQSAVANAVSATATVTVPMVLMSYFGAPSANLSVACQALYDVADTDVMFVLDTTGSMSCYPSDDPNCYTTPLTYPRSDGSTGYYSPEKSPAAANGSTAYSKLESLRRAVLLFDSTMRANADSSTHFRYGFAPYSVGVNVGRSLPTGYLQNTSWTYQSRQLSPVVDTTSHTAGDYNYGNTSAVSLTNIPQSYCVSQRYPATGYATSGPSWNTNYYQAVYYYNLSWTAANGGTCSGTQQPLRALWNYGPYSLNISQYAAGASVADPSRLDGKTSTWRGCVEELNSTAATSFDVNNLPHDLDPDYKPTDPNEKWRPIWGDAEWLRNSPAPVTIPDDQVTENSTYPYGYNYRNGSMLQTNYQMIACEAPAQRLAVMNAQQVHDYVYANDFRAFGDTYHDLGMTWGVRMLSPNSIFGDSTAWPGRNPPSRSIVFMTDGTPDAFQQAYTEYGVEQMDQRVDGGNGGNDAANHETRFRVECDAAKARGITIYVVALGTGLTDDLNYCASPGQAFSASSTDQLTAAFANIAKRVAKLRISL